MFMVQYVPNTKRFQVRQFCKNDVGICIGFINFRSLLGAECFGILLFFLQHKVYIIPFSKHCTILCSSDVLVVLSHYMCSVPAPVCC